MAIDKKNFMGQNGAPRRTYIPLPERTPHHPLLLLLTCLDNALAASVNEQPSTSSKIRCQDSQMTMLLQVHLYCGNGSVYKDQRRVMHDNI